MARWRRLIARIALLVASAAGACPLQSWSEGQDSFTSDQVEFALAPVDLSFLNEGDRPAGRHGFVRVDNGDLVFADGEKVRFWGTNITGRALFLSSKTDVQRQARRLARLGFNLVRIHHHDADWIDPNIFGAHSAAGSGRLDKDSMTRIDWLIKCLEDEGIYVWLDLCDSRVLKPSDKIDGFTEISKNGLTAELKGYNFVNPSIEHALKAFNEQLLTHVNSFTGLRYVDDPGIAALLLINENDVTNHFGNALLPNKSVPFHTKQFMAEAQNFADRHGYSVANVWRTWQAGLPKVFLNDVEYSFYTRMVQHLRSLGVKIPIVTTSQWGSNPLSSLPGLTSGDIADVHGYGGFGELSKNPAVVSNIGSDIAAAHLLGFPLTVTEWNVSPFPVADRHVIPLYLASLARYQRWSALMQYAYTQLPLSGVNLADNWEGARDPSYIASLPAAALLFRRGDVAPARTTYVFAPSYDLLFDNSITAANSTGLRTAAERGRLLIQLPKTPDLPWLEAKTPPPGSIVFSDPEISFVDPAASNSVSDTGELMRNWRDGVFTIDTPLTQAAAGEIAGSAVTLKDLAIKIEKGNCAVAVQSLDGRPIAASSKILISVVGQSAPVSPGRLPFASAPVSGIIQIRAKPGLALSRLIGDGLRQPVRSSYSDGTYSVDVGLAAPTHWLVLEARREH